MFNGGQYMFHFFKTPPKKIETTRIINEIETRIYSELKSFGFSKYGRTLHRFVDGDISQVINFQCGQAYRNETHLMWVNVGIRVPECVLRSYNPEQPKKYYHEYECNLRSTLGEIKNKKAACYDLHNDIEKIISDISKQIHQLVLPAFDILNSRSQILKERNNYRKFDTTNSHLILLEEAMIYGKLGNVDTSTQLFNEYYKKCLNEKNPNFPHIQYLEGLAANLKIILQA